jgi:hypothetical protein
VTSGSFLQRELQPLDAARGHPYARVLLPFYTNNEIRGPTGSRVGPRRVAAPGAAFRNKDKEHEYDTNLVAPPAIAMPPLGPLSRPAVEGLRQDFIRWGHRPSQSQFNAIAHIPVAIEDILHGRRQGQFITSACDAGLGKSSAIIHSVRQMLLNPDYRDASALVCIPRISEIEAFLRELGEEFLHDVAVLVNSRERKLRAIGKGHDHATDARLLVSTQAAVRKLLNGHRMLADVDQLKFKNSVRPLRIHDEWLPHALEYAIPTHRLSHLGGLLADIEDFRDIGEAILDLTVDARRVEDGGIVMAVEFDEQFADVDIGVMKATVGVVSGDLEDILDGLWEVSGQPLRVHKSQGRSQAVITYKEYLPPDFFPVLVTDASGRVRELYEEIKHSGRCEFVELPRATKDYSPLTVHHWDRSAAKHVFAKTRTKGAANPKDVASIIGVCAKLIQKEGPTSPWLIVHPGGDSNAGRLVDIKALLAEALEDIGLTKVTWLDHTYPPDPDREKELAKMKEQGLTIATLSWGRHDATNAFKLFDRMISIGSQYDPDAVVEVRARGSRRLPLPEPLKKERLREIRIGELKHHELQSGNRFSPRVSDGHRCGRGTLWKIASSVSGIDETFLKAVYPGCIVRSWKPAPREIKSKRVLQALEILREHFKRTTDPLPFVDVYTRMGLTKKDFRANVRMHEGFREELRKMGVQEARHPSGQGYYAFELSYRACGFGFEDEFAEAA